MMRTIRVLLAGTLLFQILAVRLVASGSGEGVADGRQLYEIYCRSCHGDSGRGDGPAAAELRPRPADLTRIRSRNDGEFPEERIRRKIDGRDELKSHGTRRMPVWGLGLQELDRDADQEGEVQTKIRQLTTYLRSIQITD
jgi:mono/diheme cytochrome c family protein